MSNANDASESGSPKDPGARMPEHDKPCCRIRSNSEGSIAPPRYPSPHSIRDRLDDAVKFCEEVERRVLLAANLAYQQTGKPPPFICISDDLFCKYASLAHFRHTLMPCTDSFSNRLCGQKLVRCHPSDVRNAIFAPYIDKVSDGCRPRAHDGTQNV